MSAFGPSLGISRDLRQVAQIEKDLSGRLIPRASIEQLRSKKTQWDEALARAKNDFSVYSSRVSQRDSQSQSISAADAQALKEILLSLEEITPAIEDLLSLPPEKLLEHRGDARHCVERSKNIARGKMQAASQGIERLSALIDAELKTRAETLSLWEAQEARENAAKQSEREAQARRMQDEKSRWDVLERKRLEAIAEQQRKAAELERQVQAETQRKESERKEHDMLTHYLLMEDSPLKTAVVKSWTPLLRAKFTLMGIQNEVALVKAALLESNRVMLDAKVRLQDERERLDEGDLDDSELLEQLKIRNRVFSDKFVDVSEQFETLTKRLEEAKKLVSELESLQAIKGAAAGVQH